MGEQDNYNRYLYDCHRKGFIEIITGFEEVNENIHLIPSLPPGCLEVWPFQLGGSPPGSRPWNHRRDYISHLSWKHLGLPEEEDRKVEVQNIQSD